MATKSAGKSAGDAAIDQELLDLKLSTSEKLLLETAKIRWHELQRYFAGGKVIAVAAELDLVHVATKLHEDNAELFKKWMAEKLVAPVTDEQAVAWYNDDVELWAVVISPWVLVQAPSLQDASALH